MSKAVDIITDAAIRYAGGSPVNFEAVARQAGFTGDLDCRGSYNAMTAPEQEKLDKVLHFAALIQQATANECSELLEINAEACRLLSTRDLLLSNAAAIRAKFAKEETK